MATHTYIGAMLGDLYAWVQAHPDCRILSADNPQLSEIGYYAYVPVHPPYTEPEQSYQVSISTDGLVDQCSEELADYMRTAQGRLDLARILKSPPPKIQREEISKERPVYPTSWEHLLADDPV